MGKVPINLPGSGKLPYYQIPEVNNFTILLYQYHVQSRLNLKIYL